MLSIRSNIHNHFINDPSIMSIMNIEGTSIEPINIKVKFVEERKKKQEQITRVIESIPKSDEDGFNYFSINKMLIISGYIVSLLEVQITYGDVNRLIFINLSKKSDENFVDDGQQLNEPTINRDVSKTTFIWNIPLIV